jgi:hypothetical protein
MGGDPVPGMLYGTLYGTLQYGAELELVAAAAILALDEAGAGEAVGAAPDGRP